MHLRKGLPAKAVSWIGPNGKPAEEIKMERQPEVTSEDFGVAKSVQDLLSHFRTDLDSFTEIEAYSLMLDGYQMSREEFYKAKGIKEMISSKEIDDAPEWGFMAIAHWMQNPSSQYIKHLEVGGQRLFKVFRLSSLLTILTSCFGIGILIAFWILIKDEL